jgi:hypothetical protein
MLLPWIEYITFVVGIDFYQLELGDPVRLTVPRYGWDAGVLFQVIGIVIKLTEAKIELRIARRNVIQPVPPSWLRTLSEVDHSQQEYGRGANPGPEQPLPVELPSVTTIDLSPSTLVRGAGSASGGNRRRWVPGRGITFIRPGMPEYIPPPYIVESQKVNRTAVAGGVSFTFGAAQAGDFLFVCLCNVTHSNVNVTAGWSTTGAQFSDPSGVNCTYFMFYKVADGGETSVTFSLFSGTGMKSAVFVNVRGSDGALNGHTSTGVHTGGAGIAAPQLTGVPAGSLAFSAFAGGDDFLSAGSQFDCAVTGGSWSEVEDACSNIASNDQGGITVASMTGIGTLDVATGTFSRSVAGRCSASFYLTA